MEINLVEIIQKMGAAQIAVVGVLTLMALYSTAVFFERLWVFMRVRSASSRFAPIASKHLQRGDHAGLAKLGKEDGSNYLGTMLAGGLDVYLEACKDPSPDLSPIELARRELQRQADTINQRLRRGLTGVASVGSTAPFVGLLGTVLGIIEAFKMISASSSAGIGAVGDGIAEALIVTAYGLMIAIPAVFVFNTLSTRADAILLAIDKARGEASDYLEAHHTRTMKSVARSAGGIADAA